MTNPIDISAAGLSAQRQRMQVISNNLANMSTTNVQQITQDVDGQKFIKYLPYRRQLTVFQTSENNENGNNFGVSVPQVVEDPSEFRKVYDPNHPHAVKNPKDPDFGYVLYPNVDPLMEMTSMIMASRAYEANVTAIDTYKTMSSASLRILA